VVKWRRVREELIRLIADPITPVCCVDGDGKIAALIANAKFASEKRPAR
jgi:hypothetical protein